jgi:hypothetical protein
MKLAADALVLWKVSYPDDDNLQEMLDKFDPDKQTTLRRASTKLSNIFGTRPEDDHLHILIQCPSTGRYLFSSRTHL